MALAGAVLLLVVHLGLSVALVAVSALSRVTLRRVASESPRLAFLEHMQEPPSPHRSAALILRQLGLLGATLLLALAARWGGWTFPFVAAIAATAVLGVLVLEAVVSRSLALWRPRQALRLTAPFVRASHAALYPVVVPLRVLLERIDSRQQLSTETEEEQDEEVEALIEVGERSGLLEAAEGEMMRGIVDLDETLVREIMTPRTAIEALEVGTSVADARRRILAAGHSRLPVFGGSIDNVVGVLHSRDLFQAWEAGDESRSVERYLRPAVFVPETLSAAELLAEMRQRTQIALVVDEYGGVAGLVTLEDVLEEIVGDIRDEHEIEEVLVREDADGSFVVDAGAHVEEIESRFDLDFGERDFDTVGGLVIWGFGRVPRAGETLHTHGLDIEVLHADDRRVYRVRVRRAAQPPEAASRS